MVQQEKVNDSIFKELIKRGYSLDGKTRIWNIADSKLWYLTPAQAQAYLDLESNKDYQKDVIEVEVDLIKKNIHSVLKNFSEDEPFNILDLGCGDGKKAILFINALREYDKIRYCPVDISSYMVEKAIKNIGDLKVGEVVEFQWNISDFENIENITNILRSGKYQKNLILLLGNTLGNFEINELLYEIRSSMKDGDVIVIGNGLDNRHPEEIIKSYTSPEVNNFLKHIPLQLGLNEKDVEFGTRFVNSRVELYYTIKVDKVIKLYGKEIRFNKGDQIVVALSYKYSKDDFMSFMKMYFNKVEVFTSKDNSYALAVCKK